MASVVSEENVCVMPGGSAPLTVRIRSALAGINPNSFANQAALAGKIHCPLPNSRAFGGFGALSLQRCQLLIRFDCTTHKSHAARISSHSNSTVGSPRPTRTTPTEHFALHLPSGWTGWPQPTGGGHTPERLIPGMLAKSPGRISSGSSCGPSSAA